MAEEFVYYYLPHGHGHPRPVREKRYHGQAKYYDNPVVMGREKFAVGMPQPVWSSHTTMYNGGGAGGGAGGGGGGAAEYAVIPSRHQYSTTVVNGNSNTPNVFVSDLEMSRKRRTHMSPTRHEQRKTEVRSREVVNRVSEPRREQIPPNQDAETEIIINKVLEQDGGGLRKEPTARVYSDFIELEAALNSQSKKNAVAKIYSDFQDPKEFLPNDETGENVARVYSSYSEINAIHGRPVSPSKDVIRSHESGLERGRRRDPDIEYTSQSDWGIYRPSNPVGRTQSHMQNNRVSNGVYELRPKSPTNVDPKKDKIYYRLITDPVRHNYMVKKESEMIEEMKHRPFVRITSPGRPVERSFSDADNFRHFKAPNDPNAIYAEVSKNRQSGSHVTSGIIHPQHQDIIRSASPRPVSPGLISPQPGSPRAASPCLSSPHPTSPQPLNPNVHIIPEDEAVLRPAPSASPGLRATGNHLPIRNDSRYMSIHSSNAPESYEKQATDMFKFLEDFDDALSFGEEANINIRR